MGVWNGRNRNKSADFGTHECVPYRACARVGAYPDLRMRHGPGMAAAPTGCSALIGASPDLRVRRRFLNCGYGMPGAFRRHFYLAYK